jgi:predicted metal-dependent hydrolase
MPMRMLTSLFRSTKPQPAKPAVPLELVVEGRLVRITLKRRATAKRLTLRMGRDGVSAVMTVPNRVSRAEAQRFAERSNGWIATQLQQRAAKIEISHNAEFLLRGEPHRIVLTGKSRGVVLHEVSLRTVHVPGLPAHVSRRLQDWLKQEAKRELAAASQKYATAMEVKVACVAVRDQKSRWGSCSSSGALSYSWRLILAPQYVLDYVAAHEVAHLREMNHSPRFWRLVLTHCADTRKAKDWLKKNGRELHRVG